MTIYKKIFNTLQKTVELCIENKNFNPKELLSLLKQNLMYRKQLITRFIFSLLTDTCVLFWLKNMNYVELDLIKTIDAWKIRNLASYCTSDSAKSYLKSTRKNFSKLNQQTHEIRRLTFIASIRLKLFKCFIHIGSAQISDIFISNNKFNFVFF